METMKAFAILVPVLLQSLINSGSAQEVRLVDGDNNSTGRLEIFNKGTWNTVFKPYFTINDAKVVCRMLGFETTGVAQFFDTAFYGQGSGQVITSPLSCKGTEQNISECNALASISTSHSNDVSISCSPTQIRLTGGDTKMSGRVELFLKGAWATVCDAGFDNNDAEVVCSMLGYGDTGIARPFKGSVYGTGSGDAVVNSITCTGNEVDIVQCRASWGTAMCSHRNDAGVNCGSTGIRLVSGTGSDGRAGRVELYHAGAWGTICDRYDNFDRRDAMVMCRMLGFNASLAIPYSNAFYGEGNGPVILSGIQCDGSEADVSGCTTGEWHTASSTSSHCPHKYDVGVNCAGLTRMRLVDGDSEQSGRVELYRNGHWGTLGPTEFDSHDLEVICRMMGYHYSAKSFFYATSYYGQGVGEVVADNLQCDGLEKDIGFCHGVRWYPKTADSNYFGQRTDVGVNCDGEIKMRVSDGPTNGTGRLEIYHGGYWGTVCASGFDRLDLIVVCKNLGYNHLPKSAYFHGGAYYGQGLGQILVERLQCNGIEENIGNCAGTWPASSSCSHGNDLSVSCDGGFEQIRLANGTTKHEGRVEVFHDNQWWVICGSGFDRADAVVVCRMLGMKNPEHARALVASEYGRGTGKILMSKLQCNGLEANLDVCKPSYRPSYCTYDRVASVNCCPGCSTSPIIGKRAHL